MKTWSEIERYLKNEVGAEPPPADLHHRIMRSVRDDRAAAAAKFPRRFSAGWMLAGTAAAAMVIAVILQSPRPSRTAVTAAPTAPEFSLENIEAFATAPVKNEMQSLQTDFASAARFISSCLPGGGEESVGT